MARAIRAEEGRVIAYLQAENAVLRARLPKRLRFVDRERKELAVLAKALGRRLLRQMDTIASPDTLLRWHRQMVARKYDGWEKRGPGRPRAQEEVRVLIERMARENPRWGYTRIVGALSNVGHSVSRSTVARVLSEAGLEPAPQRRKKRSWADFIRAHASCMAAADFFTVEVWHPFGLVRYAVLFIIQHATRRAHIAGIAHDPGGAWIEQIARNLTDAGSGSLFGVRFLLCDRDPVFTKSFREILGAMGTTVVRLPARSPNLNAFAERFVLSVKTECLDELIVFSPEQLARVLEQYLEHYHAERNHQGLGNHVIVGAPAVNSDGEVLCQ